MTEEYDIHVGDCVIVNKKKEPKRFTAHIIYIDGDKYFDDNCVARSRDELELTGKKMDKFPVPTHLAKVIFAKNKRLGFGLLPGTCLVTVYQDPIWFFRIDTIEKVCPEYYLCIDRSGMSHVHRFDEINTFVID